MSKSWQPQEIEDLKKHCATGDYSYEEIGKIIGRTAISCQQRAENGKIRQS